MQTVSAPDFHDIVKVSEPRLSPDGERVAFVRQIPEDDESYEATVYVVPLDGSGATRFTVAEGVDGRPRWSPSGDRLAFVSTRGADSVASKTPRANGKAVSDDRPQLWVLPADGGEAEQVTNVAGGVSDIAWRPDGGAVAFVQASTEDERGEGLDVDLGDEEYEPETPDPRVIDRLIYRAGARYLDGRRSHVYVADLAGDIERVTDGDHDHLKPAWGDESTLYYLSKRTDDPDDNIDVEVIARDLERGAAAPGAEETVVRTTGWMAALDATPDGRVLYTTTPEEGASMRQTDLCVHDREADETTVLTESLDRTVSFEGAPQWSPDCEQVYFLTPDEGAVVLRRVASDGGEVDLVLPGPDRHVTGFDVGENAVAYTQGEWDHPGDVYVSTRGGAETNRLTRINSAYLDDRAVCQPEEIRFESAGHEIQGWVLTPPDFDSSEEYPLAVEIHGGPHAMWSTSGTMWHEFQTLAARGYVVFWSNPRGSTGYGEEFATAIERDWGDVTLADVLAGVDEVASREYVDEEDVFVTGGSFGGFMTAWAVGHTDRFAGAIAQRGVYDLSSFYGSTDAFKLVEWDFDALPWEDAAFLWEQSPVARAADVTTPTLVMHADQDYRVPVNNGEMFYLFLRKNGVDTRLVRYPREGHELSRSGEPGHVVDRIERIVRWFDGYSDHHDAPPALERGDDGLSAGEGSDVSGGEADDEETRSEEDEEGDE